MSTDFKSLLTKGGPYSFHLSSAHAQNAIEESSYRYVCMYSDQKPVENGTENAPGSEGIPEISDDPVSEIISIVLLT